MTAPVARSADLPVQKALYALLAGDTALKGMVSGVYDQVPEDAAFPYVTLGETVETPDNDHDQFGRQNLVSLHVWTRARGHLAGKEITGRLVELIDHQRLAVPGHRVAAQRYEGSQPFKDPDPEIRHVVARFRIITEQEG
jgi:hypothetical protein